MTKVEPEPGCAYYEGYLPYTLRTLNLRQVPRFFGDAAGEQLSEFLSCMSGLRGSHNNRSEARNEAYSV